jgi:hypothetical protein
VTRGTKIGLITGAALLVVALGALPVILAVRGQRIAHGLATLLAERFHARPDCPTAEPFVEPDITVLECYDGAFTDGRPFTLLLGSEPGSRAVVFNYIGIYVAPAPGAAWLETWRAKVRARGDWWARRLDPSVDGHHVFSRPADDLPVRADPTDEGGVILAWEQQLLPSREKVEARVSEVEASLRARP